MDWVHQELGDGCGVACLAMVTGSSYLDALKVLHPEADPIDNTALHETRNEDLIQALKDAGFRVDVRIHPDIRTLRDAILVVRYRIGLRLYWHTVVWSAEDLRVLDPFDDRPFEEYESGVCLAFELSRSGPAGPNCSALPA